MKRPGTILQPTFREGILHGNHLNKSVLLFHTPYPVAEMMGKGRKIKFQVDWEWFRVCGNGIKSSPLPERTGHDAIKKQSPLLTLGHILPKLGKSLIITMVEVMGGIGAVHTGKVVTKHVSASFLHQGAELFAPIWNQWQVVVFDKGNGTDILFPQPGSHLAENSMVTLFFKRMANSANPHVLNEDLVGNIDSLKVTLLTCMHQKDVFRGIAKCLPITQKFTHTFR